MQPKWMRMAFFLIGMATLGGAAAHAQTDAAISLYGAFTETTPANVNDDISQNPSNAAGGLLELRHIAKPWFGYEGTYSYNRANQTYSSASGPYVTCGVCTAITSWTPVSANAHEVTGDWVASLKIRNLRPFALAGGGILFNVPSTDQATTSGIVTGCGGGIPTCIVGAPYTRTNATTSSTKPVFVYGAGVDWGLLPHIGLRFQYRGNLNKAPELVPDVIGTSSLTHTAEPMIGVYLRL